MHFPSSLIPSTTGDLELSLRHRLPPTILDQLPSWAQPSWTQQLLYSKEKPDGDGWGTGWQKKIERIQSQSLTSSERHAIGYDLLLTLAHPNGPAESSIRSKLLTLLKEMVPLPSQGNRRGPLLALGQINPAPGDLAGNAQQMMAQGRLALEMEADLIIFPELSLMGYPVRDVISRHPWLVDENLKWLQALAEFSQHLPMVIGFVEPRHPQTPAQKRIGAPFYNALAICAEGKIQGIVRKSLLPTYGEYEDHRTFEPAPAPGIYPAHTLGQYGWEEDATIQPTTTWTLNNTRLGFSICEDIWNDDEFFNPLRHHQQPIAAVMDPDAPSGAPDILINISASVSRSRKEQMKHNLLRHVAERYQTPLVYVNQTGSVDECNFDGASRVYDARGNLLARGAAFATDLIFVAPLDTTQPTPWAIAPLPQGLESSLHIAPHKVFDAYDETDLGRTYEALCQGIGHYFEKSGFKRALLGLSGGIDSAVVAVLLRDALGADNVLALSMPSTITPDENKHDAEALARGLGIPLLEFPITTIVPAFLNTVEAGRGQLNDYWGTPSSQSFAKDNVQAMGRATLLRLIGNDYNALPIATSDKSEFYLGYTTVNGDMSGALAPLGDVPKTKVRALARWLNNHRPDKNVIPEDVITRPSGADLALDPKTGKPVTAESVLMPYEFADEVIWRIETLQQSKADMMAATFQWEHRHGPIALEQKTAWLDRFFRRMATSVFKWWIAPPTLIVEGNGSITKTDYHHPITANRIVWQGHGMQEIQSTLSPYFPCPSPT